PHPCGAAIEFLERSAHVGCRFEWSAMPHGSPHRSIRSWNAATVRSSIDENTIGLTPWVLPNIAQRRS
ncbi:MAG: hypothetical protein WKF60_08545, partial [Ilumatobacter sp.]